MDRKEDMTFLGNRMQELNDLLEPLILASDSWGLDSVSHNSPEPEAVVANSMKLMAKIKLNRYGTTYRPKAVCSWANVSRSARIKVHRYCAVSTPVS